MNVSLAGSTKMPPRHHSLLSWWLILEDLSEWWRHPSSSIILHPCDKDGLDAVGCVQECVSLVSRLRFTSQKNYFWIYNKLGSQFVKNHNSKRNSQLVIEMPLFNSSLLIPLFVKSRGWCLQLPPPKRPANLGSVAGGVSLPMLQKQREGSLPETETNSFAPENWWLEDQLPFGKTTFQGRTVTFKECILWIYTPFQDASRHQDIRCWVGIPRNFHLPVLLGRG